MSSCSPHIFITFLRLGRNATSVYVLRQIEEKRLARLTFRSSARKNSVERARVWNSIGCVELFSEWSRRSLFREKSLQRNVSLQQPNKFLQERRNALRGRDVPRPLSLISLLARLRAFRSFHLWNFVAPFRRNVKFLRFLRATLSHTAALLFFLDGSRFVNFAGAQVEI